MAVGGMNGVIRHVRHLATYASQAALSDRQLLDAFCADADEAAFTALVRRHGPMVRNTCLRILVAPHDADDAFQATFLILVRKAHTVRRPDSLGPWLHAVACRSARRLRAVQARRQQRERPLAERDQPTSHDREPNGDLRALLDDALNRLPECYRAALVLCELQGHSRQQAARALGVPEGTLSSRLARGRQLLADVLSRRHMLSAGVLAALLTMGRADAVPPALVRATVSSAVAAGLCRTALTPLVELTAGVINAMLSMKSRFLFASALALTLLGMALWPRPEAAEHSAPALNQTTQPPQPGKAAARKPSVILLWMSGGPSQMDTFDLKSGQANGGPFKEIDTAVKGIRISEHLPKLAKHMQDLVLIRGMSHREGDHLRARHLMLTGRTVQPAIRFATLGEVLARELGGAKSTVPNHVRMGRMPLGDLPSGTLGNRYAALRLYDKLGGVQLPEEGMFMTMADKDAEAWHKVTTEAADLGKEKDAVRAAYGRDPFGTHCLVARRLVERHVPVVDIVLSGWDSHSGNFDIVKKRSAVLDAGWSALMSDLKDRKLLDSTLIVWLGEFGRTPRINAQNGRDHWCNSFTVVLAGGGIKGGQVVGKTRDDGVGVVERPVSVPELYATIYEAVGVDRAKRYPSGLEGVTIPISDGPAEPIREIVPARKVKGP